MGLWQFIVRRLLQAVVVLFFVSLATFALAHAVPGDPLAAVISERMSDRPEVRAALEAQYGLDKPLPVQYLYYVKNIVIDGNFGESISTKKPVRDELSRFIPATIELSMGAMFFAVIIGVPLGIISALRQNRWQDNIARILA